MAAEKFPPEISVSSIAKHGTVYKEVLDVAGSSNADLIVLTSHRPDRRDYLLGPTLQKLFAMQINRYLSSGGRSVKISERIGSAGRLLAEPNR